MNGKNYLHVCGQIVGLKNILWQFDVGWAESRGTSKYFMALVLWDKWTLKKISSPEHARNDTGKQLLAEEALKELWTYSNLNSLECRRHARGNPSWRSSQLISTEIITKAISRMCSDKADSSSAIVIEMLYFTCIWETGTIEVFDLIGNIISRVSKTTW